ncbi:MAG: LysM peptidoglycan-binding domain-containing protein [Clostridia bacterium]|nr:LysM peptidoglycan-binding domain-containing protein [Clostridia bacterium]
MYMLYIDNVLFPVAPGKIVTQTEIENETYALVDGSRVNRSGGRGLKKISFELLLPMKKYPFAHYEVKYCDGEYYVELLNHIADENEPVSFDLYRSYAGSEVVYLTSMKVLIEKISVVEDAENSPDILVSVVLREHRSVSTKTITQKDEYVRKEDSYTLPETYRVQQGDSLWLISKRFYGDGARYVYLAEINSIKKPYTIYTGQQLKLRE